MHGLENLADTKIADLNCAVGVEKDVGGLDVPMENLVGMDALQSESQLHEPVDYDLFLDELSTVLLLAVLDEECQIAL